MVIDMSRTKRLTVCIEVGMCRNTTYEVKREAQGMPQMTAKHFME